MGARAMGSWSGLLGATLIGALVLGGCGSASTEATPSPNAELPGLNEELPEAAAMGSAWESGEGRLPPGIDPGARFASDMEASFAVTEPFGRRPMPPGSEGIVSYQLEAPPGEMRVLVTYPVFDQRDVWGEQFLLVLREGSDGWSLREAHVRELCTTDAMAECHD